MKERQLIIPRKVWRMRERERETDRQTDRQTETEEELFWALL